jgi:DNA-3-methyladenine glycosylase II
MVDLPDPVPPPIPITLTDIRNIIVADGPPNRITYRDQMSIEKAEKHLVKVEPKFAAIVKKHGACVLVDEVKEVSIYESLMRAILFQQLSGKAASTIRDRLYAMFPDHAFPPADQLVKMTVEEFRSVGVSRQKAGYLQDLALKADTIPSPSELHELTDEEIIERLIPIKGVGRWTIEMLLMFTFGRMDVLPVDDMGVQEGFKRLFDLDHRPKKKEMEALAEPWRPYRSIGSWYMWRLVDDKEGLSVKE